ncbi:MAG: reverse transcriptase domain-containing protein [Limisphaerales bacterium]
MAELMAQGAMEVTDPAESACTPLEPASEQVLVASTLAWLPTWRQRWMEWTTATQPPEWLLLPKRETTGTPRDWWTTAGVSLSQIIETGRQIQALPDPERRAVWLERLFPHPRPEVPSGGRLQEFSHQWEAHGLTYWAKHLREGIEFDYQDDIPPQLQKFRFPYQLEAEEARQLWAAIEKMRDSASLLEVTTEVEALQGADGSLPEHIRIHPLFIIKQGAKWRPIFDCRGTNRGMLVPHFKMLSIPQVPDLVAPLEWMWGTDLADAYLHVPVMLRESWRHTFVVQYPNRVRYFRAPCLVFGQAPAPMLFTKLMTAVLKILRLNGVTSLAYIDDVNGGTIKMEQAWADMLMTFRLLQVLGFRLKWTKTTLPNPQIDMLGWSWDLRQKLMILPPAKITNLCRLLRQIKRRTSMPMFQLARVLGTIAHAALGIPLLRTLSRPLQRAYNETLSRYGYRGTFRITIDPTSHARLTQMMAHLEQWQGRSLLLREPTVTITADATPTGGWGAHTWHPTESRLVRIKEPWTPDTLRRYFPDLDAKLLERAIRGGWLGKLVPNNALEAIAQAEGFRRLELEGIDFRHQHVLFRSDNTTTVSYLQRHGGRSLRTSLVVEWLELELQTRQSTWTSSHVAGVDNRIADFDSRTNDRVDRTNYLLNRRLFRQIDAMWGPHSIDLFANGQNAQVRRYCTWGDGDPEALAQNAYDLPWKSENPWIFPPLNQIPRILKRLRAEGASATLLTPDWPSQLWFPMILEMAVAPPIWIPTQSETFLPGSEGQRNKIELPQWNRSLVWRLSGDDSRSWMDSSPRLPNSSRTSGQPPISARTPTGSTSIVGAGRKGTVHLGAKLAL